MIRVVNDPMTIAGRLRPVLLRLARELRREIHSLGVTGGQVSLLASIKHNPGITATELAERERVSAPSMNRTVNCLEESGWLTRTTDEVDRRKVNIALTGEGLDVVEETVRRRDAWLESAIAALPDAKRAILRQAAGIMREVTAL